MKPKEIYGLSRSRDKQGKVVKRSLNDYVNCLHTQVGSARDNMEVYVIEMYEQDSNPPSNEEGVHRGEHRGGVFDASFPTSQTRRGRVQDGGNICPTITCNCEGLRRVEPFSVAMRGRNPNNPSERGKSNGNYKQRLEMNESGVANTITSVQKDSMVAEPMCSVHPNSHKFEFDPETSIKPISPALRATDYKAPCCVYEPRVEQVGNIYPDTDTFKNRTMGRVYSNEGLSPTINCCGGGDREPKIVEDWQTVVGNKQLNPFRGSVEGASPCITSACGAGGGMTPMLTDADLETTKTKEFIEQVRGHEDIRYRIRKLTPRECFRLMGVDDADIDKIQASGISNSQQYKCAGNSIVVDVLYHIFRKMFCETENESDQLCLF